MKKNEKRILLGALGLLVLIQFVPIGRHNPPVTEDVDAPAEVKSILRSSCYDCHSNETRWPAYAYVAPVSWVIAFDVHEARDQLNFSQWDRYSENAREYVKHHAVNIVTAGEMPPRRYLILHSDAEVTPSELSILEEWASPKTEAEPLPEPDEGTGA